MTDEAVEAAIENELRLLDPAVRNTPELLAELLHPDFHEFGVSGRRWDRDSIIASLTAESASTARPITTTRMKGVQLAPGLVQLTFDTDSSGRRAHRSSLWRLTDRGWLLYFHQGTPYEEETEEDPDVTRRSR
ncbi:nuclear transport factor 2 family protein [Streptomyces sp. NPDC055287]